MSRIHLESLFYSRLSRFHRSNCLEDWHRWIARVIASRGRLALVFWTARFTSGKSGMFRAHYSRVKFIKRLHYLCLAALVC
jgi:hypothetical protein